MLNCWIDNFFFEAFLLTWVEKQQNGRKEIFHLNQQHIIYSKHFSDVQINTRKIGKMPTIASFTKVTNKQPCLSSTVLVSNIATSLTISFIVLLFNKILNNAVTSIYFISKNFTILHILNSCIIHICNEQLANFENIFCLQILNYRQ